MVLRALDESARIVAQLRAAQVSTEALPLGVRIDQLVAQWSAVCSVQWNLDPSLEGRVDLGAVSEIVEEGLANAYRHGEPDLVIISIAAEGDDVLVEVRDDGRGPMGGASESSGDGAFGTLHTPGLGRRLIDAHTGGRCTLERAGDWTILAARVSPAVQG
jgi:signal transduction histidine kinase